MVTVSMTMFCQSFQALAIGGIALFLPVVRHDLALSFKQAGTLAAASALTYSVMQVPSGILSDRFGPKRVFFVGVLGTTVLSLTFALATSYWQALVNQAVSGFFRSLLFAPGLALLAGWFPPQRRATAMGLYLVGGLSGNLFLDIGGPFLAQEFGWRALFVAFSIGGIVASFAFLYLVREPPVVNRGRGISVHDVLDLCRYRLMWLCGAIQYVRLAVMMGVSFWLPSLLVDEMGLSLQVTGFVIAVRAALVAPSNIVGGYVSDRLKNPVLVIGFALLVLAATNSLLVVVHNLPLLFAVIVVNSLFVQFYFGPLFAVPAEVLGARKGGTAAGFGNFFANVGGLTFTYLLGVLKDMTGGFGPGFYATSGAALVGFVFALLLARTRKQLLARSVEG